MLSLLLTYPAHGSGLDALVRPALGERSPGRLTHRELIEAQRAGGSGNKIICSREIRIGVKSQQPGTLLAPPGRINAVTWEGVHHRPAVHSAPSSRIKDLPAKDRAPQCVGANLRAE